MTTKEFGGGKVLVEANGKTARLVMNRPEALNALDMLIQQGMLDAIDWINKQEEIVAVVVATSGRGFCAGFDLSNFRSASPAEAEASSDAGRKMAEALSACRPVTVSAAKGPCVGGGMVLVMACDLRVVADDTTFFLPETAFGIPLAWGGVPRLVREVGPAKAMELILLGDTVAAADALALGVVNEVVPLAEVDARAQALAEAIARRSKYVVETTKLQVRAATEEMVSTRGSFADARLLHVGFNDPESTKRRKEALAELDGKRR